MHETESDSLLIFDLVLPSRPRSQSRNISRRLNRVLSTRKDLIIPMLRNRQRPLSELSPRIGDRLGVSNKQLRRVGNELVRNVASRDGVLLVRVDDLEDSVLVRSGVGEAGLGDGSLFDRVAYTVEVVGGGVGSGEGHRNRVLLDDGVVVAVNGGTVVRSGEVSALRRL